MKNILLMFVIMTVGIFAQSVPSGYTTHLGLRLYAQAANPGADSLNQNALDIDAGVKANYDLLNTTRVDFYSQHNDGGAHKNGSITWANLATAAQQMIVIKTLYSSNVMRGTYTFDGVSSIFTYGTMTGVIGSKWLIPPRHTVTDFAHIGYAGSSGSAYMTFNYGTSLVDTFVTHRWFRAQVFSSLLGANNIWTGTNTFNGVNTYVNVQAYTPMNVSPAPAVITFSVSAASKYIRLNISGATTITNFTGAVDGQEIIVQNMITSADTLTIRYSGGLADPREIYLAGGVNRVLAEGEMVHLIYDGTNSIWFEVNVAY